MKHFHSGVIAGLVLGFTVASLAEDVTVTTYYPSPRGVYDELRTSGNTYLATQAGNVGVGTAGPLAELHVKSNTSNADVITESSDGFKWTMSTATGGRWILNHNVPGDRETIVAEQSGNVLLAPSGTGNVGIGTTVPSQKLEVVNGKILVTNNEFMSTGGGVDLRIGAETFAAGQGAIGTLSSHPFDIYAGGARAVRVTTAGNVGIGTTAPTAGYRLDVNGSVFVQQNLRLRDSGGQDGLLQFDCVSGGQCYATYAP